jgi:hypothetical protein
MLRAGQSSGRMRPGGKPRQADCTTTLLFGAGRRNSLMHGTRSRLLAAAAEKRAWYSLFDVARIFLSDANVETAGAKDSKQLALLSSAMFFLEIVCRGF